MSRANMDLSARQASPLHKCCSGGITWPRAVLSSLVLFKLKLQSEPYFSKNRANGRDVRVYRCILVIFNVLRRKMSIRNARNFTGYINLKTDSGWNVQYSFARAIYAPHKSIIASAQSIGLVTLSSFGWRIWTVLLLLLVAMELHDWWWCEWVMMLTDDTWINHKHWHRRVWYDLQAFVADFDSRSQR